MEEKQLTKKTGRLFFAIVPPATVQQSLYKFARMIRLDGSEKVTNPDLLHITLRYIGPVEPAIRDCLVQKTDSLRSDSFSVRLNRLGFWKKPQITWCSPDITGRKLQQLVNKLDVVCRDCSIKAENREYHPHITLIRKSLRRERSKLAEELSWLVDHFVLFESVSTRSGVNYNVLKKWRLTDEYL